MPTTNTPSRRAVLVCMAVLLIAMAAILLSQRLNNPSLTEQITPRGMGGMGGMEQARGDGDVLSNLMREVQQNPNNVTALLHLAEHLMQLEQWAAAENFAERARQLLPQEGQPLHLLAVIKHNQGKPQEAANLLEELVKAHDDPLARYSLGVLYIHYLHDTPKGVAHLTEGLHSAQATPDIKELIRKELETAPLAHTDQPGTQAPAQTNDAQSPAKANDAQAPAKASDTPIPPAGAHAAPAKDTPADAQAPAKVPADAKAPADASTAAGSKRQ